MRIAVIGLLLCMAPPADPQTTRQKYDALLKEYEAADAAWNRRFDDAAEVDWEARFRDWPGWSFARRFVELAESDPDDPAATDALLWVVARSLNVGVGDRELYPLHERALTLLARGDRLDDERIGEACRRALSYPSAPAEHFLRLVLEVGRDRQVRGLACLCLADLLATKREIALRPWFDEAAKTPLQSSIAKRLDPAYREYIRRADPRSASDEAERLFERAAVEFGEVVYRKGAGRGGRDLTVADAARSGLNELRNLAVGRVAPEIEGEDIDGRPMRLSDFRGKVVVLSFWASWCGPCMGMVPHERSLVGRLEGKPFVLLGVDGDEDRGQAKRVVQRERMTWRSWWNGGPTGPITERWSVASWPTIYVLDAKGVIRYKDVREERLDEAVDTLLKEAEAARP
jgi:thiol-disulfide isomerase/thioredoxin